MRPLRVQTLAVVLVSGLVLTIFGGGVVVVALRGGMGTITEISLVWNKLVMNVLPSRPLILLGDCWPAAIRSLREHLVISDSDLTHLDFVSNAEQAIEILRQRAL